MIYNKKRGGIANKTTLVCLTNYNIKKHNNIT